MGGERLKYTCYVFEIIIITYIPSKNFFPKFDCLQNIEELNGLMSSTLWWHHGSLKP